jgi:hypothetical protein
VGDANVERVGTGARWDRWLVIVVFATMAVILGLSFLMADRVASDHAYFHAMFALIGAVPAGILATRPHPARWRQVAIVGLELLAITQLVEAVGAWGFAPDNDTVTGPIKGLHDVGLAISPLGLLGAVVGVAVAVALALRAQGRSMVAVAAGGGTAVVGLVVVAKLIGL